MKKCYNLVRGYRSWRRPGYCKICGNACDMNTNWGRCTVCGSELTPC